MRTPWVEAFPHTWGVELERHVSGRVPTVVYYPGARRDGGSDGTWLRITPAAGETWTGVFSSDNRPGRLSVVASWPDPERLFVAAGGDPYLVRADDPDDWSCLDRPTARFLEPYADLGLCLVLDDNRLSGYDATGLAWESGHLGPAAVVLGRLDDEVHVRVGDALHRVDLRHGRTTVEPAAW